MKKIWEDAAIETLEINETAGGPNPNLNQDGEIWWNADQNRWEIPVGEEDKLSS